MGLNISFCLHFSAAAAAAGWLPLKRRRMCGSFFMRHNYVI